MVVANFTDDDTPWSEYVIPGWPKGVDGWMEVTRGRHVPAEWVGQEPLMAWETKVYILEAVNENDDNNNSGSYQRRKTTRGTWPMIAPTTLRSQRVPLAGGVSRAILILLDHEAC